MMWAAPAHDCQRSECEVASCSLSSERYRHAHGRAVTGGFDLETAADQFHSLLHTGDADTKFKPRLFFPSLFTSREAMPNVANFQLKPRVTIHSYFGSVAP